MADRLATQLRCIVPTWPLGSHRRPIPNARTFAPLDEPATVADAIAAFAAADLGSAA